MNIKKRQAICYSMLLATMINFSSLNINKVHAKGMDSSLDKSIENCVDKENVQQLDKLIPRKIKLDKNYLKEAEKSLNSSYDILIKLGFDDLSIAAAKSIGKNVPETYLNTVIDNINKGKYSPKYILGTVAVGEDPSNIANHDLIKNLYSKDLDDNIFNLAYYLIALDSGEFNIPKDHKFTKKDIINKMIEMQISDKGGWGFGSVDIDSTDIVLTALAPHKDDDNVKEAIKKGVAFLNELRGEDGEYHSEWLPEGSSESISQTIITLCCLGIDPTSTEFVKGDKNLIDSLLEYRTKDGGFQHTKDNLDEANIMATQQAFTALSAYKNLMDGKGSIYRFDFKQEKPVEPQKSDFKIENLTNEEEFKLGFDAKVTIKAINNMKQAEDATLIVGLFDENNELINYGAVEQNIEPSKSANLRVMLKIPNEGKYNIKAFVWDSLDNMKSLSNVIEIPVK